MPKQLQANPNSYILINFYIFVCLLLQEDTLEETGWKLVHGDVFRPPQRAWLLTAFVGSGVQIFCMVVITLGECWFEILNLSWFVIVTCSNVFSGRQFVVQSEHRDVGNNNKDIYSTERNDSTQVFTTAHARLVTILELRHSGIIPRPLPRYLRNLSVTL